MLERRLRGNPEDAEVREALGLPPLDEGGK
jgi:hypothetical protein